MTPVTAEVPILELLQLTYYTETCKSLIIGLWSMPLWLAQSAWQVQTYPKESALGIRIIF